MEGLTVAIGGWRTGGGAGRTKEAVMFAESLTRATAPWASARGEAFWTIPSLELLGALVGVTTLVDDLSPKSSSLGAVTLTCGTDNQGNTSSATRC